MHFSVRLPLLLAVATSLAHAQTVPPATPPDDSVSLENVVVTASPYARSQAELTSATTVLGGRELLLRQQPTLGETLAGQPGVSSSYFGPGASRPVIRGLDANRVRVLQNGTDTIDASSTSPDHAVSVEPFLVKRIEIVRGPASLLYGGAAVGGVVNVIDHRIESELPENTFSGTIDSRYDTNTNGYATGGSLDVALAPNRETKSGFVLHLDGFRREADDVEVPGFADPSNPASRGHIPNTQLDADGGSIGLSYVNPDFNAGLNYNGFNTTYGVPNEPSVEIELRQRRYDFSADYNRDFGIFTGARAKFGVADYQHTEFEGGVSGTVFTNKGYNGRVELLHGPLAGFTGAFGAEVGFSDFSAVGAEAYLPTSDTQNLALFVFEEAKTGAFTWQAGARYEHRAIDADAFDSVLFLNGLDPTRTYAARSDDRDTLSLSSGVIYTLNPDYSLAFSLTHTTRAPNAQELYADGPHIGTDAYEVGNASFDNETALGAELSLRKTRGFVTGALTVFANRFDGYIFLQDTATPVVFEDPDGIPGSGDEETLPEFRFVQRDALFYGVELETVFHLHDEPGHTLDLRFNIDHTRASEIDGPDLPRIPPVKGLVALDWGFAAWRAGIDVQYAAEQRNRAPGETPTDGYALLGVSAGYRWQTNPVTYDFFVRGSNLTDESARNASSFANIKDIAPLPGRAITFGVRASF
ncbi:TonB-dependent receptor [Rariglobus hedericola]|uniref:TonB-dependent receptor n=1 Tax=Rariglobus hedericola TaxID=2597822 RepID=A0A556QKG6_9BACT|nr:TonB-dependent receptor [Rariglobus hedericola]TSJ77143.1 TonB-dependent receptor [Rariglobus hedericola]